MYMTDEEYTQHYYAIQDLFYARTSDTCIVPVLYPDESMQTYYFDGAVPLVIPAVLFNAAIAAYRKYYHCTEAYATRQALMVASWDVGSNGAPFFYV